MTTSNMDIGILSVHPSVGPFVCHAPVLCQNGLTHRHTFFSSIILGFPVGLLDDFAKFRRGHPFICIISNRDISNDLE